MPRKKIKKITEADFREIQLELARIDFWEYSKLRADDFYLDDREYLRELCYELQDFLASDDRLMLVNIPPRHGKSRTLTLFTEWLFGNFSSWKVIIGSYNNILSQTFSKAVRGTIQTEKVDPDVVVYKEVFPEVAIKRGEGASDHWAIEGQHASYLATSPSGTATGFGCDLMILDDLIKSAAEANNAMVLEKIWAWFTDTMISRLEEDGKIIIVMTRWHSKDLAGLALEHFKDLGWKVRHIIFKALQDDGSMLCPTILSYQSYMDKTKTLSPEIAAANYQQEPIDLKGRLYTSFKLYEELPCDKEGNSLLRGPYCQVDTADEGSDFLCAIIYGVYLHEIYVLDVYYTRDPMEITELELAKRLTFWKVALADIESNSGGRGFSRAVARILSDVLKNYITIIKWFTQSGNKNSRIVTMATWVMEHIYFPTNWRTKWPEYAESMCSYQREGVNLHDDAEDCTTALAEKNSREQLGVINVRI